MDKEKNKTPYAEKFKQITLSDSARARISEQLSSFADFHTATETERVAGNSRSIEQVSQARAWHTTILTRFNRTTMPVLGIMIAVIIGGGTTYAAQDSLPGDTLYPIKTSINENIRAAFAVGAEAEAELQTKLLEERVEEAKQLASKNKLEGTLALRVQSNIAAQADKANEANDATDSDTQAESDTRILAALNSYNRLTAEGSLLAIGESELDFSVNSQVDSDASVSSDESSARSATRTEIGASTMIALEPVSVDVLLETTEARIDSLREVIAENQAELEAETYLRLNTTLKDAHSLMLEAQANLSAETSRELLFEANDLVGQVESQLSLLGTVIIDTDTGIITDIDLSTPPPVEPIMIVDPIYEPLPEPSTLQIEGSSQGSVDLGL